MATKVTTEIVVGDMPFELIGTQEHATLIYRGYCQEPVKLHLDRGELQHLCKGVQKYLDLVVKLEEVIKNERSNSSL